MLTCSLTLGQMGMCSKVTAYQGFGKQLAARLMTGSSRSSCSLGIAELTGCETHKLSSSTGRWSFRVVMKPGVLRIDDSEAHKLGRWICISTRRAGEGTGLRRCKGLEITLGLGSRATQSAKVQQGAAGVAGSRPAAYVFSAAQTRLLAGQEVG